MNCQSCNVSFATVHVIKIVGDQKEESHWCLPCARAKWPPARTGDTESQIDLRREARRLAHRSSSVFLVEQLQLAASRVAELDADLGSEDAVDELRNLIPHVLELAKKNLEVTDS